jgi:hypothetical protein
MTNSLPKIADVESGRRFPSIPAAEIPPAALAPKTLWRAGSADFRRAAMRNETQPQLDDRSP